MKFFVLTLLGLATTLATSTANESNQSEVILFGPHGEIADNNTQYILVEDDNGVIQKGYLAPPNVSFSIPVQSVPQLVKFHLWTRNTTEPEGERLFVGDNETLQASTFNHSNPTKFLVHGFGNTIKSPAIQEPKDAYLGRGEYNVIGVDWGAMCVAPWYSFAVGNTMLAGNHVGEMIMFLVEAGGANLDDIHLIGHSLGAHVCGIAGSSLGEHKVSRVTGLDPAGPLFYTAPPENRIDPTDAHFVDVIHTCGGYSLPDLGFMEPTSMADFYPNAGVTLQPTCSSSLFNGFGIPCSHSYAYKLWTETVKQTHRKRFDAFGPLPSLRELQRFHLDLRGEEETVGLMGEDATHTMRGIYWLSTA